MRTRVCMWHFKVITGVDISFEEYCAFVQACFRRVIGPDWFSISKSGIRLQDIGNKCWCENTMTSMICEACKLSCKTEKHQREDIAEKVGLVLAVQNPPPTVDLSNRGFQISPKSYHLYIPLATNDYIARKCQFFFPFPFNNDRLHLGDALVCSRMALAFD